MRTKDLSRAAEFDRALVSYSANTRPLPGISSTLRRATLVEQLIDSRRRIEFVHTVRDGRPDARRADPADALFDPLKAAVLAYRSGNVDEAFWLVFLATHFGKHATDGWRLTRDIHGRLGKCRWDWQSVSTNPDDFRKWLAANGETLERDGVSRRFSNHRKYESLSATSRSGTAAVFASYVAWVAPPRNHAGLIYEAHRQAGQHPQAASHWLYESMSTVQRFGRLGKFDFLSMLGKLGIAPIAPDPAYLGGATGPLTGARLLFDGNPMSHTSARKLDAWLLELDAQMDVGMQTLEDALCNWQKSPDRYRY